MNNMISPSQYNNKRGKFFGTLMNNVPFAQSIFGSLQTNNPKYKDFDDLPENKEAILHKHAIFRDPSEPQASFANSKAYSEYVYSKVDVNKIRRIQDYRRMAAFAELSDAIDEICDESISEDMYKEVVAFEYRGELSDNAKKEVNKEWKKFVDLFDLPIKDLITSASSS